MTGHPDPRRLADLDAHSPARRELLEHVRSCRRCRAIVVADDPARIFSLLYVDPIPDEALDRLSDRVGGAISARGSSGAGRLRRFASLAAALALAAAFGGYAWRGPGETARSAVAEPAASAAAATSHPADGSDRARKPGPVRRIELLSSPSAGRVVNLSVGETRVVMIFDEDLDI